MELADSFVVLPKLALVVKRCIEKIDLMEAARVEAVWSMVELRENRLGSF